MYLVDLTLFMDTFVQLMINGVNTTFTYLDSFMFHGISLLDFCLAMILIPTGLSIFVAISKVSAGAGDLAYRGSKSIRKLKKDFDDIDQI